MAAGMAAPYTLAGWAAPLLSAVISQHILLNQVLCARLCVCVCVCRCVLVG